MPTIACLIRCKNSSKTLPSVLASLRAQTRQPDFIVAVDNGSTDDTVEILARAGAIILPWTQLYSHPQVLNFGLQHCPPTDYVLVLSSHTALNDIHTIASFAQSLDNHPQAAAVSLKWGADCYSDAITYHEIIAKGMRLCSIYTNSLGMIRRSSWEHCGFDESIPTAEDYDWSLAQLAQGRSILRLSLPFEYQRQGHNRAYEFTRTVFRIAAKHRHRLVWQGPKGTLTLLLRHAARWVFQPDKRNEATHNTLIEHWAKLRAWGRCSISAK